MPAGFLDGVDMIDIKLAMRRKKRIIIRWHLFVMLSLNPTLLKYRFKNPLKKRRYNLDLINQLNPALYWPEFNKEEEEESDTEEEVVRHILDNESGEPGKPKFSIRCKKTGKMFEVVYSLKSMTEPKHALFCGKKSKWDKIAENLNELAAETCGDNQIAEKDEGEVKGNIIETENKNMESLKFSTAGFIDIEAGNDGDEKVAKYQNDTKIHETVEKSSSPLEDDKLGSSLFIEMDAENDGDKKVSIQAIESNNAVNETVKKSQSDQSEDDEIASSVFIEMEADNDGDKEMDNSSVQKKQNQPGSDITDDEEEYLIQKDVKSSNEDELQMPIDDGDKLELFNGDNTSNNNSSGIKSTDIELGVMNSAYAGDDGEISPRKGLHTSSDTKKAEYLVLY